MSKSVGNVVNPFFALDRWGVDPMRFFLMFEGQIKHDSDYSNAAIADRYKKHLQAGVGNLTSRLTRPKTWSVARVVADVENTEGMTGNAVQDDHMRMLEGYHDQVVELMDGLNPRAALQLIMEVLGQVSLARTLNPRIITRTD